METTQQNTAALEVIHELVEMSIDGEKGFTDAAALVEDASLKSLFEHCAQECGTAVVELNSCAKALGDAPDHRHSGSVAGTAHRQWQKVKAAFENSNIAVLEEVERGEDHAKAAYMKALKSDALPPIARTMVQKQYEGVLRNHDRIRDLRNSYRAQA